MLEDSNPIKTYHVKIPKTDSRHLRPLRGRFTHQRVSKLLKNIYSEDEYIKMQEAGVDKRMMFGTNPHYQALTIGEELSDIEGNVLVPKMPPSKAIGALILPRLHEAVDMAGAKDPSNQMNFTPNSNSLHGKLLHKYDEIVLGYTSPTCSAHCRYCYRLDLFNKDTGKTSVKPEELRDYIVSYNKNLEENDGLDPKSGKRRYPVRELLLSGGDIMVLPNRTLYRFAVAAGQAEVHLLRFGTKEIAFRPERFDDAMIETFKMIHAEFPHMHFNIVSHYSHPDEFLLRDEDGKYISNTNGPGYVWLDTSKAAIDRLNSLPFLTIENQTPIIQKVNDNETDIRILHEELRRMGIKFKYLFQGRDIEGHRSFSLPVEDAWNIHNNAMKGLSDTCRSRFSMSTEWGKMEVVSVIESLNETTSELNALPPPLQIMLKDIFKDGLIILKCHRSPNDASTAGELIIAKRNPDALWISGYEDRIIYDGRKDSNQKYTGLINQIIEGLGTDFLERLTKNKAHKLSAQSKNLFKAA